MEVMMNRICEKIIDGVFVVVPFSSLEPGDTFKLTEPDGVEIKGVAGNTTFKAKSKAFFNKELNSLEVAVETVTYRASCLVPQ
jgi:hypothetical protein